MARTLATATATAAATPPTTPPTICGNALPGPSGDIEAEIINQLFFQTKV